MQMTLDGYVAGPKDEMDWMKPAAEEWTDLFKDIEETDTYLLGRKMYPGYSDYWRKLLINPSHDANENRFAWLADKTQHIVFTKGNFQPDWKNTKVAHDPGEEIKNLKNRPGKNIIAWGGAGFASDLIRLGFVDELRLVVNPVILGEGKNIFGDLNKRYNLQMLDAVSLKTGSVILRYKVQ